MNINKVLQDKNLSCKAKGVASIIENLGIKPTIREIMFYARDSRHAIRTALAELEKHDYIYFHVDNQLINESERPDEQVNA